ncbi:MULTISPECIES: glycine--tRNA ligase subunit beta [Citromicrobium]|uniref:glycine--tRNA ligase subunit beta n=1 Tax=Citromicrobium TaxID=72173 RepID=UPI0002E694F9|nr:MULTISPECIES: glycine--tRNA ligase subunit beta [Citromicrobium]ALG62319.1 glycyl-tRNA synthetase subunit beta [Citromicrobium sp. JL477]KPM15397.1 glycyl-tRNA synthetase subunit beta [Citromicrobium sp. JL1351]KPM19756.1 glycyl-tRNA synthetase subunit beta [Citromicrobium sp. JL31]KPM26460.1 glycyl-tRNA synthetase subunit beta [Citromicrobium sp. JL2201]
MTDFLLEMRSEEIPARMQAGARAELEKLFRREMDAAGVSMGEVTVWSTPRRLALIARGLPTETQAVSEEAKGPPVGAPDQAVDGFCRKNNVTRDQLEVRDVKGRETYFAVIDTPGRAVRDVLAEAIPAIIRDFAWPKSMRWGAASISTESMRWVRPLSGIVALLGDEVVECEVHGVTSGAVTLGHRFHHSGDITIGDADDYAVKLRAAHVIVDHQERAALIREGAARVASEAGLSLVEDEGLVVENAGLTEWPIPLLGRFEEDFLSVPPETIQLTARVNQKYFVCEDAQGTLANAFICTANIEAADGGAAIVDGNRKVLAARLSDARFFWEVDQKKTLAQHAEGLKRITFHEKLGTVADKVERVAKLARWLVESDIVTPASAGVTKEELAQMAEDAAKLCKADLVTEMVGEFPELQGLMGGYYAGAEGLPDAVADAIRDHYKPVGQGDEVPTAPVTVAVSLADKLDTLFAFFMIQEYPTGSKDPFALRRAANGILSLTVENGLRFGIWGWSTFLKENSNYPEAAGVHPRNLLHQFLQDRLKVQQREAGVRHDLIDAVRSDDDNVRLLARVHALQSFMETEDGKNLLAGYKRAANILKKEDWQGVDDAPHTGEEDPLVMVDDPDMKDVVAAQMAEKSAHPSGKSLSYTPEPAEKALMDALDTAGPQAATAVREERFADAMSALASLRAPIDDFFENVTVNDENKTKRSVRLGLLARFRDAVHQVADFGKIEG